jgi:hypothetical protein
MPRNPAPPVTKTLTGYDSRVAIRFVLLFLLFTFGPGAACAAWLTRPLDFTRRLIVILSVGMAATAVVIDILGRLGWLEAFPYVAVGFAILGMATWRGRPAVVTEDVWTPRDLAACALILAIAIGTGAIAFAHRLSADANQIAVYGDYDSLDLTYYAAISAESSHTVPPTASYYAGRELNYAYYPQLVLAMVHRFGDVPMLPIYFEYSWPTFLGLASLSAYLLVRQLTSTGTALLTVILMLIAGDFSYLAAWYLPHDTFNWDYVLWPTNFLSPTMEVLHFNSWTPSLPIFFTILWGIAYGFQTRQGHLASESHARLPRVGPGSGTPAQRWLIMSALLLGVLFQFKPFAFLVLAAALAAAFFFAGRDWPARRQYATVLILGGMSAFPFIYRSLRLYADRRSELRLDFFVLPERMLIKLDLVEAFANWANRVAPAESLRQPIFLLAATSLFFAGGLGIRWIGFSRVWRAVLGRETSNQATWRLLAWGVVAGVAIPFVIVTEPYNDTLQFYQVALYLLWIFTAAALASLAGTHRALGIIAVGLSIAMSLPSSVHYLHRKWNDHTRQALSGLTRTEIEMADYLRTLDPQATVVLNNRPLDPSLLTVLSERRVVLAWGRYAVGSEERLREVEAFYRGTRTLENTLAVLRKHQVTHVIVHTGRDKILPEVLAWLKLVMGDDEVRLYEVRQGL